MKTLLLSLTLLLAAVSSQAAVVYLKDGSQVKGTVVAATAGDIQLHTPNGSLTIPSERIQRIDYVESETRLAPAPEPIPAPRQRARRLTYNNDVTGNQYFSIVFGGAIPLSRVDFASTGGGSDSNGDAGLLLGTQYLYSINSHWSTGLSLDFFTRSAGGSQSLLPLSETEVSGRTLLLMPTVKFAFVDRGYARPYFSAGLGGNRTSTVIDAQPNLGYAWSDTNTDEPRTLMDDTRWGLASSLRLGVDFQLMDPSIFSFELGWTRLANGNYSPTQAGKDVGLTSLSGQQDILTIGLRWGWRF